LNLRQKKSFGIICSILDHNTKRKKNLLRLFTDLKATYQEATKKSSLATIKKIEKMTSDENKSSIVREDLT
jgi:hypothetical protein